MPRASERVSRKPSPQPARLLLNYASSKEGAENVVSDIITAGGRAIAGRADVSKAAYAENLIDTVLSTYGHLDIVVNNSGIYEFAPLDEITEEAFHKSFNINVLGPLLVTRPPSST